MQLPFQRTNRHEFGADLVGDSGTPLLELLDKRLKDLDASLLNLPSQHRSCLVSLESTKKKEKETPFSERERRGACLGEWSYVVDFRQLFVVLKEEAQVLVGDVNIRVASMLTVKFDGLTSSGKGVLVDLCGGGVSLRRFQQSEQNKQTNKPCS